MIAIPIWAEMLLGALLGFAGVGMALRARPGPRQKLFLIGGGVLALVGAFLLLSNFL
jgi:CHASE2 domain-containing sensor protein